MESICNDMIVLQADNISAAISRTTSDIEKLLKESDSPEKNRSFELLSSHLDRLLGLELQHLSLVSMTNN